MGWCDGVVRWGGAVGWCDGLARPPRVGSAAGRSRPFGRCLYACAHGRVRARPMARQRGGCQGRRSYCLHRPFETGRPEGGEAAHPRWGGGSRLAGPLVLVHKDREREAVHS